MAPMIRWAGYVSVLIGGFFLGAILPLVVPQRQRRLQEAQPETLDAAVWQAPAADAREITRWKLSRQWQVNRLPFQCDPLERVYVISARGEEGRERRKTLKKELETAGIAKNVSYWPSVDPRTDPKLAQELGKESCPCDESMARALTHRQIYEKVIDEQLTCATIFEDTVSFAPDFQKRLSTVKESVPAFDVLQLGYCGDTPPKDDRKIPKVKYGLPGNAKCFHSYVVSLPGALFLAKANRPLKAAPGDMIDYLKDHFHVRPYVSRTDKSTWNRQISLPGSFWSLDPALTWQ